MNSISSGPPSGRDLESQRYFDSISASEESNMADNTVRRQSRLQKSLITSDNLGRTSWRRYSIGTLRIRKI